MRVNLHRGRMLLSWYATLLIALVGCGGGVETGGTGPTASSYVEGPVTGFGSVIVAAIRFDDTSAKIEDADGNPRNRSELRLGMRLEVEGGAIGNDADGVRSATASRMRIVPDLLGLVTAIESGGTLVSVLGQSVRVTSTTVVEGAAGVAALRVGDIVEVHGFVEASPSVDRYVATRIERRAVMPAAFRVRGLVRDVDPVARTLRIGGQLFDLSASGIPAGLVNGEVVRLTVAAAQSGGRWSVLAAVTEPRRLVDREAAEIEGLITALTSATRFAVNGVAVDASNAVFDDGRAGVQLGARVKVRGRTANGELVASLVELRSDDDAFREGFDLRDVIAALDTTAQTFLVRGVTVFYGTVPPPRFDDGSAADLANGRRVRVRATLSPERTRVIATRIEFIN